MDIRNVFGSTTEIPLSSDINVSPLLNVDRNEVDIFLSIVEDTPLPPEYTKAFSGATLPTTTPTANHPIRPQNDRSHVVSTAPNLQQLEHTKSGKSRGGSTDAIVDNVLQAYKRVLDKISKGSIECRNDTALLLRALSALWAGRAVDSILHSFEHPSSRKSFAKHIVKNFLSEELVLQDNWLEQVEGVLCNSYCAIVKTVADATRCNESTEIADEILFAFFVEDLLTGMLSSNREKHVNDAVGRLLKLSGISNGKQGIWKAFFNKKRNLDTNKKIHNEGKNTSKRGLLSEKSLAAAVFSGAVIGDGGKSRWELIHSDTTSKGNQKRSVSSDYEGTDFAPFAGFRLVPLVSESEDENTDEYFDYENNWKQTSSKKSHRRSEGGDGSSNKGYSVGGYGDLLATVAAHLDKSVSPTTYDVSFTSVDYEELTLVTGTIPEEVKRGGILDGKKHYHEHLKQNKRHLVHESTKNDTKVYQGHKTNGGTNCSFTLSKENEEESKNSYTESMWSQFIGALGSWIKFFEKMKDSGQVESALESDGATLHSSRGTKLSLSEGNQRTGTTTTGGTGFDLIKENKQMSYEEAVVVMDLANELEKMINASQEKEEGEWNEHAEDNGVDTQAALGTGGAVNKTTEASILSEVIDFLMKLPQHVSNMTRFIK